MPQDVQEWWEVHGDNKDDLEKDGIYSVTGINTIGQSLKNPSWDIRGDIPQSKYNIGPWHNSSIEFDPNYSGLGQSCQKDYN
jgi:hypothetical protein